jgi:predicted DNA-binding protein
MPPRRENPKSARVSVSLEPETYADLFALASRSDVTVSWMARRAVVEMIEGVDQSDNLLPHGRSKDSRVSVSLTRRTHEQLVARATRDGKPTSAMVCQAVKELVQRANQRDRVRQPGQTPLPAPPTPC